MPHASDAPAHRSEAPLRGPRELLVQTLWFEGLGIALISPLAGYLTGESARSAIPLLAALSLIVMAWTAAFNAVFDRIELRRAGRVASDRPTRSRIAHALLLEGTGVLATCPAIAWLSGIGWLEALRVDLALTATYAVWAFLFHRAFDRLRPVGAPRASTKGAPVKSIRNRSAQRSKALALTLLLACSAAWAGGRRELRPSPSGDDTAQLQAALWRCEGARKRCVVRLGEGVFSTDVLLAKRFRGELRGRGAERTTIRALTTRALRSAALPFAGDPTLAEPYPVLLHFADGGRVSVSDLRIEVPASIAVEPYQLGGRVDNALLAALMVDGASQRAELTLVRSTVVAEDSPSAPFASSLFNAVRFEGQIREPGGRDQTRRLQGGRFVAQDSTILRAGIGIALRDADAIEALVVRNRIDARVYGVFSADLSGSRVGAVRNRIDAESIGIGVTQTPERPPAEPTSYLVAENQIGVNLAGTSAFGASDGIAVFDFDYLSNGSVETLIANVDVIDNRIELGDGTIDGVGVLGDGSGRVRVLRNSITGAAPLDAAIAVFGSQGTEIAGNDFGDAEGPFGDVHLGPDTRECVVDQRGDSVIDEGVDNLVH